MQLTTFETELLTLVLGNEWPQILGHVELLEVTSRENTGSGAYIHFGYRAEVLRRPNLPNNVGSSVALKIDGLKGGAGCVLFFKDGKIDLLELFSYGDSWPNEIKGYKITTIR